MTPHRVTIEFDDFGFDQLTEAAARQGVSVEELLVHAGMYYLADLDGGRMATKVFRERVNESVQAQRQSGESAATPTPERS